MSNKYPGNKLTIGVVGSSAQVFINTINFFVIYILGIKYAGIQSMGVWSLTLATISLIKLTDFGLNGALIKFIAKNNKLENYSLSATILRTGISFILFLYISMSLLLFYFSDNFLNLIIDDELIGIILPYFHLMLINCVLSGISVSFLACLDGINRIDLRALINIFSSLSTILLSFYLIPKYGLLGVIYSQIFNALLLISGSLYVVLRFFRYKIIGWLSFYKLRELFIYGFKFQLGSVTSLSSEAFIRLLISKYGNVSDIPYYEMARKLCDQIRSLFAGSATPIVPIIAGNINTNKTLTESNLFKTANRWMMFFALPIFSILALSAPLLSYLFFNNFSSTFLIFTIALSIASIISIASLIPFNISLGNGLLKWNSISYVIYIIVMISVAWPLSAIYSSLGSVYGICIAIILSSIFIITPFKKANKLTSKDFIGKDNMYLFIFFITSIIFSIAIISFSISFNFELSFTYSFLILLTVFPVLNLMWKNDIKEELLDLFKKK